MGITMPGIDHSCAGKLAFPSRSLAQRNRGILSAKHHGVKFDVYHCALCGHWHVGKNRAQQRKLRARSVA